MLVLYIYCDDKRIRQNRYRIMNVILVMFIGCYVFGDSVGVSILVYLMWLKATKIYGMNVFWLLTWSLHLHLWCWFLGLVQYSQRLIYFTDTVQNGGFQQAVKPVVNLKSSTKFSFFNTGYSVFWGCI
jgi:hypothetical protein